MPPKGYLSKALCLSAGGKIECITVSIALQYPSQDRHYCHYRYWGKICSFLLSSLVDPCHWGNIAAWFIGSCPVLYAGTIWRALCLGGHSAKTLLYISSMEQKWLTIYLFMSITNLKEVFFFPLKFLNLTPFGSLCPSPLLLHIHFLFFIYIYIHFRLP